MLDLPVWAEIFTAAGAFAALAVACIPLYDKWTARRSERRGVEAFQRGAAASSQLHRLMRILGAQRAVVLRAHNGGGPVHPPRMAYSSAQMEARGFTLPSALKTWIAVPCDEQYFELLDQVTRHELVHVVTENLTKESAIRDYFESQDIAQALWFPLWGNETEYFYVSLDFRGKPETAAPFEILPKTRNAVRLARQSIISLLRDRKAIVQ